jgi:uncharacterized protein (DUF924 family)
MSMADSSEPGWVGEVLGFWFQELEPAQWFARDNDLDMQIRERFLALHERLTGEMDIDLGATREILAAVIVLDQFSRNMFRGSPRAYETDDAARRLAQAAVNGGLDAGLQRKERMFLYLPFEHSEDRSHQEMAVRLIERLGDPEWTRYALAHQAIIEKFGRFPHRNAALGRSSTPEEEALMREPMGSF